MGSRVDRLAMWLVGTFFLLFGLGTAAFMFYLERQSRGSWLAVTAFYAGIAAAIVLFSASVHLLARLGWFAAQDSRRSNRTRLLLGMLSGAAGGAVVAMIAAGTVVLENAVIGAVAAACLLFLDRVVGRTLSTPRESA